MNLTQIEIAETTFGNPARMPDRTMEPVPLLERVWLKLTGGCLQHRWSSPITLNVSTEARSLKLFSYSEEWDSHEVCLDCGIHRLYNAQEWVGGPVFRQRLETPAVPKHTFAS